MKNIIYILAFMAFSFGAEQSGRFNGALDWYGYGTLLSTELYTENHMDDDDNVILSFTIIGKSYPLSLN